LERGDLGRDSIGGTGFVREINGFPELAVATLFDCDFRPTGGHDGKETVSGGEVPRGKGSFPWGDGGAGESQRGEKSGE